MDQVERPALLQFARLVAKFAEMSRSADSTGGLL
jgi:hypothetical protein